MTTDILPHPDSADILDQDRLIASQPIGSLIVHAACDMGQEPVIPGASESTYDDYYALPHSRDLVFANGGGHEEPQWVELIRSARSVYTPQGGTAEVTARDHTVGGRHHPLEVIRTFRTYNPDGTLGDNVFVRLNEADPHDPGNPAPDDIVAIWDNELGVSRTPTQEEVLRIKRKIAGTFGLRYREIVHGALPLKEGGGSFEVPEEAKTEVDDLIKSLVAQGLRGSDLHKAVLSQLHPDTRPDDPDAKTKFQYASQLDYSASNAVRTELYPVK